MKESSAWHSPRVEQPLRLVRWGHYGTPVLVYPTAGGDAEEIERFQLIGALWPLIDAGRIKVYSVDNLAGRVWISPQHPPDYRARFQNAFDAAIYHEVVPAIRQDCRADHIEIVAAGASLGAFAAVASLCRHPDVFRAAVGMSGTYNLEHMLHGQFHDDFYFSSPVHFLPGLDDAAQLHRLRQRFALLTCVGGRWEDPSETWRLADILGSKGIPNRVDAWGPEWDHDWPAWRAMLPRYLDELA